MESQRLSIAQAEKLTGMTRKQVERLRHKLKDLEKYRRDLLGAEYLAAQLADPDHFRTNFTGQNEWHTPAKYIEMARAVLGEIDLDPASSDAAQKTVRAIEFFKFVSPEDNGLTKVWHGRVWLNPPYSPKEIAAFVTKLCDELASGRISAAIMLTHNYTDSAWFQRAAHQVTAICFPDTRIRFEDPHGVPCSPTQGQAFFYFGTLVKAFAEEFSSIGFVVVPLR
jgi:phage N-6-adenine-methyltransferase